MALFVASLAFEPGSLFTDSAKIGILGGSLIAGVIGFLYLRATPPVSTGPEPTDDVGETQPALVD